MGYWRNGDAIPVTCGGTMAGTGEDPFLRTGDLGCTKEGHLFLSEHPTIARLSVQLAAKLRASRDVPFIALPR